MSKQCSLCGSYNTERSILGTSDYVFRQVGRFTVAGGATMLVGVFDKNVAQGIGRSLLRETESWTSGVKQYHCCTCCRDF